MTAPEGQNSGTGPEDKNTGGSGSGPSGGTAGSDSGGDKGGDTGPKPFADITDPDALRALAARYQAEAASNGGKARDKARADAAAAAEQETLNKVLVALGKQPDEKADPAKAAATISALGTENAALRREVLTYRAALAPGMNANVARLTDSRSFMAQVDAVDPTDSDAQAKITALIKSALTSDQSLRSAQVRGGSLEHSGGAGDQHTPDNSNRHGADLLAGAYAANASKSN